MKRLLLLLLFIPLISFGQSKKELKKIERLVNSDRIELFIDSNIKKIDVITLIVNDRWGRFLKPHIQKTLLREGIKVLSMKAATERLLELKTSNNSIMLEGKSTIVNSSLILDVTTNNFNGQIEVEIIDLTQEGAVVGYLTFKSGAINFKVVGPAIVKKIIRAVENN